MTTYADVHLKAEVIRRLAKLFGFSDVVKICYYLPEKANEVELRFVVNEGTKPISFKNSSWLGAKVSAELGCDVEITVYEGVDNLYRYDTDRRSALITEEKAIKEVVYRIRKRMDSEAPLSEEDLNAISAIKLEDIECKNIPKDDKWLQEGVLKNAEEYLKKNAEQQQKLPVVEATDPYSIVGKSPSQQKRKPLDKEADKQEPVDDRKKAKLKIENGNDHTAEKQITSNSKAINRGRSP